MPAKIHKTIHTNNQINSTNTGENIGLIRLFVNSDLPVQFKNKLIFDVQYSTDTVWFLSIEYPLYSILDLLHKGLVLKLWACDYRIPG